MREACCAIFSHWECTGQKRMPMDEKKASSLSKRYLVLSRYNILRLSFDARHCNAKSKKRFLNFAITPADMPRLLVLQALTFWWDVLPLQVLKMLLSALNFGIRTCFMFGPNPTRKILCHVMSWAESLAPLARFPNPKAEIRNHFLFCLNFCIPLFLLMNPTLELG